MPRKSSKGITLADPVDLEQIIPTNKEIDWNKCCLCQKNKNAQLICPYKNKDSNKRNVGYTTLANALVEFKSFGALANDVNIDKFDEGYGIAETLKLKKAKWHKICGLNYSSARLQRAKKRCIPEAESPPQKRMTRAISVKMNVKDSVCFLCNNAGTWKEPLHRVLTDDVHNRVKTCAIHLSDEKLLALLSEGDLHAQEAKYHKKCLQKLCNKCRPNTSNSDNDGIKMCEGLAFADLVRFIQSKLDDTETDYIFLMSDLTTMYRQRLARLLHIEECQLGETRSTTLRVQIQTQFPELEAQLPGKEYRLVPKKADITSVATKEDFNCDALAFARFSKALRSEMSNHKAEFNGEFYKGCQEAAVPPALLAAVNMLMYGSSLHQSCKATQPALTICQLIVTNHKKTIPKGHIVRHATEYDTPLPLYMGLLTYGTTRNKKAIDEMHSLGIGVSPNRVSEITSSLCDFVVNQAEEEGLLCPSNLRRGVFTIGAYDNVDHNPSSTTSVGSFHGTSISVFQTPKPSEPGEIRVIRARYVDSRSRITPQLPDNYAIVPNIFIKDKDANIPSNDNCNQQEMLVSDNTVGQEWKMEDEWMNTVNEQYCDEEPRNITWAAFHANNCTDLEIMPSVCSLLPLFHENSSSPSMIRHGMDILRSITMHLNMGQCPVICLDQPLFATAKLIQWNWPEEYREKKFVVMLGPFHIEQAFLRVIGQFMSGSGWISVAVNAEIANRGGAEALMKVTHVTKARGIHQITAASLHILLKEAYNEASVSEVLPFDEWIKQRKEESPTFKFWIIVMNLEIILLTFVRALRDAKYGLFKTCLKIMLPWFFFMNHKNYARWLSVHVKDLEALPFHAPEIHNQFTNGNFVIRKTRRPFSALAVDQAHEQHNALVKGNGGAVGLTDDPVALRKWAMSGPEICRIINSFTEEDVITNNNFHHEQYPAFQKNFVKKVRAMVSSFREFGNPFQEENPNLIAVDTKIIADESSVSILHAAENTGKRMYEDFVNERFVKKTKKVSEKIHKSTMKNLFSFQKQPILKSKINNVKCDLALFQRCFIVSQTRKLNMDTFFKYENQTTPPSLACMGEMRHCNKSDIIHILEKTTGKRSATPEKCGGIVYDGAALVHLLFPRASQTFGEYCSKEFIQHIIKDSQEFSSKRVDLVWDCYSADSLKNSVRDNRGSGIRCEVRSITNIPKKWKDFLCNTQNKEGLFKLLGEYALEKFTAADVVTNIGEHIRSRCITNTNLDGHTSCIEEADGRIILHVKDMVENGLHNVLIRTVDTDVVIIAISFYFTLKNAGLQELWVSFAVGKAHRYIPIHLIAEKLGEGMSVAIRGYHAFTGCDTVSSFSSKGKISTWKTWQSNPDATVAFKELSHPVDSLNDDVIDILEKYVIHLYCNNSNVTNLNDARKLLFAKSHPLQNLPPTLDALKMHSLRAAHQAGQVWGQALNKNCVPDSPANWGWKMQMGQWIPQWTTLPQIWDACRELVKCSCKKGCKSSCSCQRNGFRCTVLCTNCTENCTNIATGKYVDSD